MIKHVKRYKIRSDYNHRLQQANEELEASNEQLMAAFEQLEASEQKYRLLVENMTDILFIIDASGRITFINKAVERTLGYKSGELFTRHLENIMCPLHHYANCSDIIAEMSVRDLEQQELWMLHSDGTTRKVLEADTRRLYENGELVGVQGIARDITERIRMERKLKKRNKQLSVLDDISGAIIEDLSYGSLNVLLRVITKAIVETTGAPLCTIRLLEDDGKLHCQAASGVLKDHISQNPIDIRRDVMGKAVLEERMIVLNDLGHQYVSEYNRQLILSDAIKNVIFIPMFLNKKPIGVLSISSTETLEEDYMTMLNALANIIVFAIERTNLYFEVKQHYLSTIKALVVAMEVKDTYTQGHSVRVSQNAVMIGRELGLTDLETEEIEIAGILHDIGKIGISDTLLSKPGCLEPDEFETIKLHPEIGRRILEQTGLSENVIMGTLLHHKRFDLRGYPITSQMDGLPLVARIIGVADAYDAMISFRSYKSPMTKAEAVLELQKHSGTQFCPEIVRVMQDLYDRNLL